MIPTTRLHASIRIGLQLGCCEPLPWRSTNVLPMQSCRYWRSGKQTLAEQAIFSALSVLHLVHLLLLCVGRNVHHGNGEAGHTHCAPGVSRYSPMRIVTAVGRTCVLDALPSL